MNKRLKKQWVVALRGGKYRQAQGALKGYADDDEGNRYMGFCCLGVLRDVMHPGSKTRASNGDDYLCSKHEDEAGLTPKIQAKLADMNDNGKTFAQISTYIEKHL